ncbi:MAG: rhodanese-like domain-containing protein [Chloroflexi bacterium]|nr:rhodanese-like domain-containing protein [Chloroflexota bacterium]
MLQKIADLFGLTAVTKITAEDLKAKLDNKEPIQIIDVRTRQEYKTDGHIAKSKLIPLSELPSRSKNLRKNKPIICVCRSGNRSRSACKQLINQGFDVVNLKGGMNGWKRAGFPTR